MAGSITINSNISALNAERRLGLSNRAVQQSLTRLSSGLRINKAVDDAAGLAIAADLATDRRILNQGVRNLNDGISATNIADTTIESLTNIVVRLEELAAQSANGTLGAKQRQSLDDEAQALSREYFRISRSAEFNGLELLDGSIQELRLQAGYGDNGAIQSGFGGLLGDGTFGTRSAYTAGTYPCSVISVDFDGDGNNDIATADLLGGGMSVLLGNGDGTFRPKAAYALGGWPGGLAAADFNGDSVMDIISTDITGKVNIALGKGDGTFDNPAQCCTASQPGDVKAADFNGDGTMDVAFTQQTGDAVGILLGNGDGTFGARIDYSTDSGPGALTTADFNGDGFTDIAAADDAGASVLLGNGDGTFRAKTTYNTAIPTSAITSADFNSDGAVDIVTSDSGGISVFLGNGDGTFGARSSYAGAGQTVDLAAADFNGDGSMDVGIADLGNTAVVLLGRGDGSFGAPSSYGAGSEPISIAAADLNRDGVADLVTADRASNAVNVLLANTRDGVAPLLPFDLRTAAGARQALPMFQQKLSQLAAQRAEIGAFQTRIASAVNTLQVAAENFGAAASQIMDADYAEESAQLLKNRILQQAGVAVLAQANKGPQLALSLLGQR